MRGELQRDIAIAILQKIPLDNDRPIEVVFREEVRQRGLDANGYYFMRLGEIADQAWLHDRQYSKDVWHDYCKKYLMPEMVTTKDGEIISKWVESPDGSMVVISTTQLDRKCFSEYTEICEAFGANLGVMFSANPNETQKT